MKENHFSNCIKIMANLKKSRNAIATPLVANAYKLHCNIFHHFYSFPLQFHFENCQVSVKVDKIFQLKYIPLLLAIILITTLIGFNSCVFVLLLKLFRPETEVIIPVIVFFVMLAFSSLFEWGTYLSFLRATEIETLLNQLFKLERNCKFKKCILLKSIFSTYSCVLSDYSALRNRSRDWEGLFLIAVNFAQILINAFLPSAGVYIHFDPFYYIFKFYLPSSWERSIFVILVRLFLAYVCVFEFTRFLTIIIFLYVFFIFTLKTCLNQLVNKAQYREQIAIQLYLQLQIVMKTSDRFFRYTSVLLVLWSQVITITSWWTVLKCWNILPPILTFCFLLPAVITPFGTLMLLPSAVEINNASKKFILRKKSSFHTFNRYNKNRSFNLLWSSQTVLAMKFGDQLTFNQDTLREYVDVLMINLTNSILLIHP